MVQLHIRLTVTEWDIGGREDISSQTSVHEVERVGQVLLADKTNPQRYAFRVEQLSDNEIELSCDCPAAIIRLTKGIPYCCHYSFDGYEDHDGCVWNGEDEDITIKW